ncbi:MAG: NfeD family protein [Ruminococcus sp.]|nr:NfeD family protein [Ruminococcus sp.]
MLSTLASNTQVVGWAVAFVVFLIVEGATLNSLVSIWFAIAALFAMFAAIADLSFVWQLGIFAVSSVILLILTRSLVKKLHSKEADDPNETYDIGKSATVVETVCNKTGNGRVKLDGVEWAARSLDGSDISAGTVVKIEKVDGTKLVVTK